MNRILKTTAFLAATVLLGCGAMQLAAHSASENTNPIPYSKTGHGPSIILLHDSSQGDLAWAQSAKQLASRFEVILLDVSELVADSRAAQRLRTLINTLEVDSVRIAGSVHGQDLALRYALTFPLQSQSFTLPENCDDLSILADLVNATPITKS